MRRSHLGLIASIVLLPTLVQAAEKRIEEVVVTGTQIKGAQISEALPVSVFTEVDIEALGVNSGDELLESMVEQGQNFFSESENISGGVNSARGDIGAFNLRNLGTGNTLVLLNGRRLVNSAAYQTEEVGGSFVPVNTVNAQSLPITGLRRAEVLRDGASAIYGADAVAGVVNYVLKRDFEGFRVGIRADSYESIGRNDERLTVEWGRAFNDGATNVGAFINHFRRDRVNAQDDPRWANSDFRPRVKDPRFLANTAFRNNSVNSQYGQYDAVSSVSGTGLSGPFTDSAGEFETYPTGDARCGYQINAEICGARDGQGTFRYNLNENRDLYSELERTNFYAYLDHDFGDGLQGFSEFTWYNSDTNTLRHPSAKLGAVAAYTVAADNFYNPFGPCTSANRLAGLPAGVPCTGVRLRIDNYRFAQVPRVVDVDGDTYRLLGGLRGTWNDWDWEGAATWSRADRHDVTHNRLSNNLLQAALNDTTAAAFNPFSPTRAGSNIDQTLIDVVRDNEQELWMVDFKVSNANIYELPAGPVGLLLGFEYRDESFEDDRDPRLDGTIAFVDNSGNTFPFVSDVVNSSPTSDSSGSRDVTSLFGELQIPVFENLDLQLALRFEDFSDVGNTTVGKVAFGYRPIEQVLLRGSWSEAFRAPNLVTINEAVVSRSNTRDDFSCFFVDPTETTLDCRYSIQRTVQGSSSLKPEQSTNTSFGIVVNPIDNLTITLDFWEIEKDDTIGLFGEENHIALDLLQRLQAGTGSCGTATFNPAVVRDPVTDPAVDALWLAAGVCPAGEVVRVDDNYQNLDTRTVAGHDLGIYYDFETPFGKFDIRAVGTWLDEYEQKAGGAAASLVAAQATGVLPASVPVIGFADLVRQDGNPETKQSIRVRWDLGDFGASVTGLRIGDFVQTSLTLADGTEWVVDSMTTFNMAADYTFEAMEDVKTRIRVGANNVFDERAPLADDSFGYFADQHRDLGRYYYLDLRVSL